MAFKGILQNGSTVDVKFFADSGNTGSSALMVGLVPAKGSPVPDPEVDMVAPGGVSTITIALSTERLLRIDVDVPTNSDGGTLEVWENAVLRDRGVVGDVTWRYAVI